VASCSDCIEFDAWKESNAAHDAAVSCKPLPGWHLNRASRLRHNRQIRAAWQNRKKTPLRHNP
jgi:hypothetical protein